MPDKQKIMRESNFQLKLVITLLMGFLVLPLFGQDEPPRKTPIEMASEQADRLLIDLKLNDYQLFLVDSTLQSNLQGLHDQFETMQKGGMQNQESYRQVAKEWQTKTEDSFEAILTTDQFDRYLRLSGVKSKVRKKRIAKLKEKRGES